MPEPPRNLNKYYRLRTKKGPGLGGGTHVKIGATPVVGTGIESSMDSGRTWFPEKRALNREAQDKLNRGERFVSGRAGRLFENKGISQRQKPKRV